MISLHLIFQILKIFFQKCKMQSKLNTPTMQNVCLLAPYPWWCEVRGVRGQQWELAQAHAHHTPHRREANPKTNEAVGTNARDKGLPTWPTRTSGPHARVPSHWPAYHHNQWWSTGTRFRSSSPALARRQLTLWASPGKYMTKRGHAWQSALFPCCCQANLCPYVPDRHNFFLWSTESPSETLSSTHSVPK